MTEEEVIYQQAAEPETPFDMLRRLTAEADLLDAQKAELEKKIKENAAERMMIAKYIYDKKLSGGTLALHPTFKTKPVREIDTAKLRMLHSDIYWKAKPYVSDNTAMDILEHANGGNMERVQDLLRRINPEMFEEKSKIKVDNLDSVIDTKERLTLEEEGVIKVKVITVGDARTCNAEFVAALAEGKRKRSARKVAAIEGMDEDE